MKAANQSEKDGETGILRARKHSELDQDSQGNESIKDHNAKRARRESDEDPNYSPSLEVPVK